eukprot:10792563-Lingulodinium_polyedra.AAC.1
METVHPIPYSEQRKDRLAETQKYMGQLCTNDSYITRTSHRLGIQTEQSLRHAGLLLWQAGPAQARESTGE